MNSRLLLGECKHRSKAVGIHELDVLKKKGDYINANGREIYYLLASRSGFTEDLLLINDPKLILIHQIYWALLYGQRV